MDGKTLALTIATTVGAALTLTVLVGEGFNYKYNDTLDPRAPFLRSKLTSLKGNKTDLPNKEVNKFYKNNGEGFLIATPIDGKTNEFTFKYYTRGQKSEALEAAKKEGCLKNWDAVDKFLEINKIESIKLNKAIQSKNNEFMEYIKKHWDNPTVKKILEDKNVKIQYLDLSSAALYSEQALRDKKITPQELHSLLIDMPQSCINDSVLILMSDRYFVEDIPRIVENPEFEKLDKDFRSNIENHLDDPFLKKISPNLPQYVRDLNIKEFGFRLLISRQLDVVTNEEILDFMNKVVPNFKERFDRITQGL